MKKHIPILLMLSIVLSACAAKATSPTGKWKLVSYGSPEAMKTATPDTDATLTVAEDGTVTGSGGCNSIGGKYSVDGDQVTFSDMIATLMACDDARMDQESAVLQVLSGTAQFKIEDQTLTIANNEVTLVFTSVTVE